MSCWSLPSEAEGNTPGENPPIHRPGVVGIVALKTYPALDCELKPIDLGPGEHGAPGYVLRNPNGKMPTLEDDGGGLLPTAEQMALRVAQFPEICRWYGGLSSLPAWRESLAARDAALAS